MQIYNYKPLERNVLKNRLLPTFICNFLIISIGNFLIVFFTNWRFFDILNYNQRYLKPKEL